mmetsp:Transcript_28165/g.49131  ORF Transcript_28165/g.49131 Transcript_28165/m.49131 type:complete len:274 (-) Transcript_28165:1263-2084(-)
MDQSVTAGFRVGKLAVSVLLWRHVQAGIQIEETSRMEHETRGDNRLHGPVLRPSHMMEPKVVPDHNVSIFQWSVGFSPPRQTILTRRLVHELAGWKALLTVVCAHPKVLVIDCHSLTCLTLGPSHRANAIGGLQFVSCGPTRGIEGVRIRELPKAQRLFIAIPASLELRREHSLCAVEGSAMWVARAAHGIAHRVAFNHCVCITIDSHVQLGCEQMLMHLTPDTPTHRTGKLLTIRILGAGIDDACGLHLKFYGAIHHEVPITSILIIANSMH